MTGWRWMIVLLVWQGYTRVIVMIEMMCDMSIWHNCYGRLLHIHMRAKRKYVYVPCWRYIHLALEVSEKVQARCFPAWFWSWGQIQQRDLACRGAEVQHPCYLFYILGKELLVAKMACKTPLIADMTLCISICQKIIVRNAGDWPCLRWLQPLMQQFQQCALIAPWGWAGSGFNAGSFGWNSNHFEVDRVTGQL